MIKHKFYLRNTRLNKAGESALYFLLNTKPQSWVATGVFIKEDQWDQKAQKLLPCPQYHKISAELSRLKAAADAYLERLQYDKKKFSAQQFSRAVITGEVEESFNPLLVNLILEYADHIKMSYGRYRHYKVFISEVKMLAPALRVQQVDYSFAKKYERWLQHRGNQINTVGGKMKKLKAVIHYAMNKGFLEKDPLTAVKVSIKKSGRVALTTGELLHLQQQLTNKSLTDGHRQTLRNFLFSCYTGLRYGDLKTLRHSDIKNNIIKIDMHKTGTPVSVPVSSHARALLQHMPGGRCFHVFTNEASNRHLKDIADIAGIEKVLTFHVSRHTFATISLQLGIGIKVVSEILGHSSVKITEQYLHLLDEMKLAEMQKWEKLTA
jgi:integrase